MASLWKTDGTGKVECVLCGQRIRTHANGAKVAHARRHVKAGEATERLSSSALFPVYVHDVRPARASGGDPAPASPGPSPHRGRGDAWGVGAALVFAALGALAGCQRGRITEPGGKPPCLAWVVDSSVVVTVTGYPGATAYVKRCVVGRAR